ncbi:MAG: hypothetical protein ACXVAX_06705 [Pseudobdellovibrio sp.]
MKTLLTFFITLGMVLSAHAYESDSHLRISYVMARAAGLSDAVAKYLSVGNQYIDETAMTSAMLLSSQRQLYHFHGDAAKVQLDGHGSTGGLLGGIIKSKLSLAERNHALGSIFLYHGLVEGDLQLFAAGTHTKMDTFGHAGFSNLLGHAPDGHSPDRAFLEPKKYEDMIRELMATYVALKAVLPNDPEYIDNKGALDYLNQYAERTHVQRKLTEADMSNAITLATVLLADSELQSIYREDMYKKYEYKKLALERIYDSFKAQGKINADVTFDDLFPDEFIRDPAADTTDVVTVALMKNAEAEFLKTASGKDIFDLPKLLEGQSTESFMNRYNMEIARYDSRLRELEHLEARIQTLTGLEKQSEQERLDQEKLRLLSGLGDSAGMEMMTEEFIKARSVELAQLKIADEMANHLTKDFIPRRKNEYIKHQFEGEYENRHFETHYKDEAYRRFIHKNFGVNWVGEGGGANKLQEIFTAIKNFKNMILRKPAVTPTEDKWKVMAEKAAEELIKDPEISLRERAQVIGFNTKSKLLWMVKHAKYVLQASPILYGYYYMKKLSAEAKKFAHDHMSEDMGKAVRDGKYKDNIIDETTSAYRNVQEIRAGTVYRCSFLMRAIGG